MSDTKEKIKETEAILNRLRNLAEFEFAEEYRYEFATLIISIKKPDMYKKLRSTNFVDNPVFTVKMEHMPYSANRQTELELTFEQLEPIRQAFKQIKEDL